MMDHERDEFTEEAVREMTGSVILDYRREDPFLKATTCGEWTTLDGLVSALDAADYWSGQGWSDFKPPEEPPDTPAGKRKHVRGMLEHLASYRDDETTLPALPRRCSLASSPLRTPAALLVSTRSRLCAPGRSCGSWVRTTRLWAITTTLEAVS